MCPCGRSKQSAAAMFAKGTGARTGNPTFSLDKAERSQFPYCGSRVSCDIPACLAAPPSLPGRPFSLPKGELMSWGKASTGIRLHPLSNLGREARAAAGRERGAPAGGPGRLLGACGGGARASTPPRGRSADSGPSRRMRAIAAGRPRLPLQPERGFSTPLWRAAEHALDRQTDRRPIPGSANAGFQVAGDVKDFRAGHASRLRLRA